jgi:hypothetical protein
MVVYPPSEWQIKPLASGKLLVDGEWSFFLEDQSLEEMWLYVYEVKGHPRLLKVGIAKDPERRKESYYGRLLWQALLPRRVARLAEYLFMHTSYHLSHMQPPRLNVGNFDDRGLRKSLLLFLQDVGVDCPGFTEVREVSLEEAVSTLASIIGDVTSRPLFDSVLRYGVNTFVGDGLRALRMNYEVRKDSQWPPLEKPLPQLASLRVTVDVKIEPLDRELSQVLSVDDNYVRWITSQDEKVCPYCASRHGRIYLASCITIPCHCGCRCNVAVVPDEQVNIADPELRDDVLDAPFWQEEERRTVLAFAMSKGWTESQARDYLDQYRRRPTQKERDVFPGITESVAPAYEPPPYDPSTTEVPGWSGPMPSP